MLFKTDNLFQFVEGIQFRDGEYTTIDEKEITTLKKYSDSIKIVIVDEPIIEQPIVEPIVVDEPIKKKK